MNRENCFSWAVPAAIIEFLRRSMRKVPAIASMTLALFLLGGMSSAQAGLTITEASWNSHNGKLTVRGSTDGKRDLISVWNSFAPNQAIGTATAKGNGGWKLKTKKNNPPNPVPCAVSATSDATGETSGPFPVHNAPSDCAPTGPGNLPPVCTIDTPADDVIIDEGQTVDYMGTATDGDGTVDSWSWTFEGGTPTSSTVEDPGTVSYDTEGIYTTTFTATDNLGASCTPVTRTITVNAVGGGPIANPDKFVIDTTVIARNDQADITAPGVLINDTGVTAAVAASGATSAGGTYNLLADGSFSYTPPTPAFTGDDSFDYIATNGTTDSNIATVSLPVQTGLLVNDGADNQNQFNILMNYELGMHCTGFEFAYCCVLPPYNSIVAQVVKTDKGTNDSDFPKLLEGDPNNGLDGLGRETVLRDPQLDGNGNFNKYVMRYWHEAQPRNDGRGRPQSSTLISAEEGNSLFLWNTVYDAAATDEGNKLITGTYEGATNVVQGDGDYTDANDNYASGWMNHFYIYADLEGSNPANSTAEKDKIRLGLENLNASTPLSLVMPTDCGPAFHPLGPVTQNGDPTNPVEPNTCGGFSNGNLLTFSGDTGTVVFTQMKVLENLPVMLTSPDIWEALGLPLTPFEDSIDFFSDPGLVDEDSIRPFVAMKAQLHNYDPGAPGGVGGAVMDNGHPVIGFGTAPIDIPNCERCHSELSIDSQNSAQQIGGRNSDIAADVQVEIDYWMNFYGLSEAAGDSTWYPRLKGAAISILAIHDQQHGTSFTVNWPATGENPLNLPDDKLVFPQNTRLGKESVICQKCHADNVIAVVKSADCGSANEAGLEQCLAGTLIPPITEAIHDNHRNVSDGGLIVFADNFGNGRDGSCQGCHPAHRSDGDMAGYPITIEGDNFYADVDNRDANGGCFVGRDVHSNPGKDTDGAETPEHLNAVGQWLADNVFSDQGANGDKGIWCTNCHTQLGQEVWRNENMVDLVHGVPGKEADLTTDAVNIRALPTLAAVATAVGLTEPQAIAMLDPTASNPLGDFTREIWNPEVPDANVAIVEVTGTGCTADFVPFLDPTFNVDVCAQVDGDGDPSYRILEGFCTTPDCVTLAQATLDAEPNGGTAVPVPFSAADDGRDHWLAPGEPHCADCHAAPYTEQSGNINAFPPFNYPRKASLMRYSRGHQDISCQGCHESIHGLYPVTPTIDTTSYAQAANLNHDGTHGPIKCGSCHAVDGVGIPTWIRNNAGGTLGSINNFDDAVGWAHTYTDEDNVLNATCQNCHGVQGTNWDGVRADNINYVNHPDLSFKLMPRSMMDKAEIAVNAGVVFGFNPDGTANGQQRTDLCQGCHDPELGNQTCDTVWRQHLTEGRVSQALWEDLSVPLGGCGW